MTSSEIVIWETQFIRYKQFVKQNLYKWEFSECFSPHQVIVYAPYFKRKKAISKWNLKETKDIIMTQFSEAIPAVECDNFFTQTTFVCFKMVHFG